MREEKKYTKLSDLDGTTLTVVKALSWKFKKWDSGSGRMLVSEKWEEGYQKRYAMETDQGHLEVSQKQLKDMLEKAYKAGVSDIRGKTFAVKKVVGQNDIPNYYFNIVRNTPPNSDPAQEVFNGEVYDFPE